MTIGAGGGDAAAKPLAGLKVVELARVLAGPWAGQILADLGAEVIKVERPGAGDDTRKWGPPFVKSAAGEDLDACFYHSCNRGKSSVAIDISTAQGQDAVRELARGADILIENYKVGDLARYGLDADSLSVVNPNLIYCSITGFGQTGPYAHRPGYDFIAQGMGGVMSISGEPEGPPEKGGLAYADILTGVYSVVAILAAVRQREQIGRGARIDMALLDTVVGVLGHHAVNFMLHGEVAQRFGNGHASLVPYQRFAAADGDLIITAGNDSQFAKLCAILGREDLAADPRFTTNPGRVTNRSELIGILCGLIATWPVAALGDALEAQGIPAGPINTIDQVLSDPHVVTRGMAIETFDGDDTLPGLATPIVIDGQRAASRRAAPRLGQDRDARWRSPDAGDPTEAYSEDEG